MKSLLRFIVSRFSKKKYNNRTIEEWYSCFRIGEKIDHTELIIAIKEAKEIEEHISLEDVPSLHLLSSNPDLTVLNILGVSFLETIPRKNVDKLIDNLNHVNEIVRRSAAIVLVKIGTVETLSAVVAGNNHGHGIRTIAARTLETYGTEAEPAISALFSLIKYKDINWRSHFAAADALASIGEAAKDSLLKNLDSKDDNLRYYSAYALSILKPTPFINSKIENILSEK